MNLNCHYILISCLFLGIMIIRIDYTKEGMHMAALDKEEFIVSMLQDVKLDEIAMRSGNSFERKIYASVWKRWDEWTDSSGHGAPPPDFYCDSMKIMMDVMKINDNEHKKSYNPLKQKERETERELAERGLDTSKLILNVDTGMSTDDFHSYEKYVKMAKRVFEKHIDSIPLYKKNHPDYKLGFLVFDESAQYVECASLEEKKKAPLVDCYEGWPHFHILDGNLTGSLLNRGIDFLIWFSPFKRFDHDPTQINPVFIYDIRFMTESDLRFYDKGLMICAER